MVVDRHDTTEKAVTALFGSTRTRRLIRGTCLAKLNNFAPAGASAESAGRRFPRGNLLPYDVRMDEAFREQVLAAVGRFDVLAAVRELYQQVQQSIDERAPKCELSGRCCRFEEYGHRLYVTTIEMAAFVAGLGPTEVMKGWDGKGCPFQIRGLCSVHRIRPFGCRMFFCDPASAHWQNEQYELFHAQLKRIHQTFEVPYFYVEWRKALEMLDLESPVPEP